MTATDSIPEIVNYLKDLVTTNKVALGVVDVFYGDQEKVPHSPIVCVEPGEKRRELNGAPRRTMVTLVNYLIIYHSEIKNSRFNREQADNLAEAVEGLVHTDAQMGDRVIDSMVTHVESGYQQKGTVLFRASRLTVEARSQVQLPSSV